MPINSFAVRPVPSDTLRVARASFGRHSFYMVVGDRLAQLITTKEQNTIHSEYQAENLSVLSLVTIFQYLESLTDFQAIEAIRTRADWKYALHLPLNYPGFSPQRLCKERFNLRQGMGDLHSFQLMIDHLAGINHNIGGVDLQVNAQILLQVVCTMCRLGVLVEAMQVVLEMLASHHPNWLRSTALPHWYERYTPNTQWVELFAYGRLVESAEMIGADIAYLLKKIELFGLPAMVACEEVQNLERIYNQQYEDHGGKVGWRNECCATCGDTGGLYIN